MFRSSFKETNQEPLSQNFHIDSYAASLLPDLATFHVEVGVGNPDYSCHMTALLLMF